MSYWCYLGNDHEEIAVGAASLTSQESFKLNDSFNIEENLPESPDAMLKNLERIEGVNAETEDSNVDQEADDSPQEPEEAEVAEEVEGEEEGNVVKEMFGEESDAEEFEVSLILQLNTVLWVAAISDFSVRVIAGSTQKNLLVSFLNLSDSSQVSSINDYF